MPVSPCPLFSGHRARVALMPTVSMLVLVVRLSSHVGRSVARCPPRTHPTRMAARKDAKLRGVPKAVPSATRSRQAGRNPSFQSALAVG
ncbi:hypothetical protein F5883DRAFT_189000 [Diaporthe sp. PMI_573]|nr:hypothetical protein F5883DRAFT_189000 [Diaporthaceae sp. PMI_573]